MMQPVSGGGETAIHCCVPSDITLQKTYRAQLPSDLRPISSPDVGCVCACILDLDLHQNSD